MAGQIGPQSQPDLRHPPGELHHQDTGELTLRPVIGGKVPPPPFGGIQQFRQVVRVGVGVVKGVLARVPPRCNRVRVRCRHRPDHELRRCHIAEPTSLAGVKPLANVFLRRGQGVVGAGGGHPSDRWGTIASSAVGRSRTSKPCSWWSRIRRGGGPGWVNRHGWVL